MKKILLFVVVVLIVIAGAWGFSKSKKTDKKEAVKTEDAQSSDDKGAVAGASTIKSTPGSEIILFYGEGCPHCKKIEEYIKTNKIDEKVQFDLKEVWYNKDNTKVMQEKADVCKIPKEELGVPLLFDGPNSKCYVGEIEIQDFFNSKAGIN